MNKRARAFYDRWAHGYDAWLVHYNRWMGLGERRPRLLAHARGSTLEVGVGTGVNLPYYPADVRLTGVDLSPGMLEHARQRAEALGLEIELEIGDGQALGMPEDSFDTLVATLFLSAVTDDRKAVAEMRRVLRTGGRLLVLDHVRSTIAPVRSLQRLFEPLLAAFAGWRFMCDPLDYLASSGFAIEHVRRGRLGMVEELVARKE